MRLAIAFPEFRAAAAWRRRGLDILADSLKEEVAALSEVPVIEVARRGV